MASRAGTDRPSTRHGRHVRTADIPGPEGPCGTGIDSGRNRPL